LTRRPLRVLLLANDGASGGHVTRALAIARALLPGGARPLLATTSEADALIRWAGVPAVRIPGPASRVAAGWSEGERRALATSVLEGVVSSFAPDVLVTDTFPSGPQLEARGLLEQVPRRVLVRRAVREAARGDRVAREGLDAYHLVLAPGDPEAVPEPGLPMVAVPPVTLVPEAELLDRDAARFALRLPDAPLALVSCGAGGDAESASILEALGAALTHDGRYRPVLATGPLGAPAPSDRFLSVSPVPLARYLRAFDVAVIAAGYNSSFECALAAVPALYVARPRAYDDQAARAARLLARGFGAALPGLTPEAVGIGLDALAALSPASLPGGGAAAAAREIWKLVGEER